MRFFRGLLRTGLNRDLAAFTSLLFDRHRDFENPFVIRGARIVGPGAVRQRNGAIEFALPPLGYMDAAFGLFVLLLPFSLDDNRVVRYLQSYVVGIEARKFCSHNVIAIPLGDFDCRRPRAIALIAAIRFAERMVKFLRHAPHQ
jgi:hypothetical protein